MPSTPETDAPRSLPRRLLNRLEIDRAVFYAIAARGWQFLAGPISILVIAACFTLEVQGYYYVFASLMGMQTLFELGLHGVIINVSSHEWSRLSLDHDGKIAGDDTALRRLAGIKRFVSVWYGLVAMIFLISCGLGGAVFLNHPPVADRYLIPIAGAAVEIQHAIAPVTWVAPWFCLVALNSLLIWAWAFSSMLEGCSQTIVVNRVRFMQFITGSFVVWSCMAMGIGLWATVISVLVRLIWDYWMIFVRYRRFWESLPVESGPAPISWKQEIWPLQWKMAVQGVTGFLAFNLFTLVMFSTQGSEVAGQMGMTWTILTAIESAALAWVQVRAPLFGMIAARKDWREMDRVYFRLLAISWSFYLLAVVGMCGGVWLLNVVPYSLANRLASRMLGLEPTIVFAIAFLLLHPTRCQTFYVRAHKQDLFVWAGIVSSGLIASLVAFLGKFYGPIGAAWGLLAVVAFVNVPWWSLIWYFSRRAWHRTEPAA